MSGAGEARLALFFARRKKRIRKKEIIGQSIAKLEPLSFFFLSFFFLT
jgi:hypothetical protein